MFDAIWKILPLSWDQERIICIPTQKIENRHRGKEFSDGIMIAQEKERSQSYLIPILILFPLPRSIIFGLEKKGRKLLKAGGISDK